MPTRAQIVPILTGILLFGWLFHPVDTPPPFELEENDLRLDASRLKIDQRTFERWLGWVDPYGQLKDTVVTSAEALDISLEGDARFTAQWVQRAPPRKSPRMETLSQDYAFSSIQVIMVEPGLNTSPAMFSATVSCPFVKVISPTRLRSLRRRL